MVTPQRSSKRRAVSSSPTERYAVYVSGSAPMSEEPWTLFWPRSGISAQPGLPILPVMSARLQIICTHSEPYRCSVTPRPHEIDARSASP